MSLIKTSLSAFVLVTALSACQMASYNHAPRPDYRIKLMPSADGRTMVAVPPKCIDWQETENSENVNQRMPQMGCASARNLAAQIYRPMDLVKPNALGDADATVSAGSISAYRAGKTKALIDPNADAPASDTTTGAGSALGQQ